MTLHVLEVPDEQHHWPAWLEQHLVGLHLGQLIEELKLLNSANGSSEPSQSLSSLLDAASLAKISEVGLGELGDGPFQALLQNPDSLLELQEHILLTGSEYWNAVPRSPELRQAFARAQQVRRTAGEVDQIPVERMTPPVRPQRTATQALTGLLLTAAALLLGAGLWLQQPDGGGRILNQPGLMADNVDSAAAYFNRIADAGQEWFDQKPETAADLIVLLQEVSDDCQTLIDAPHPALSAADREWFVTKCNNWRVKFDATLASLEDGSVTFEDAKAQSDQVMNKLVTVLKAGPTV